MQDFVQQSQNFQEFIKELKAESPVYPEIYEAGFGGSLYLSSLVRIKRENTWYLVHCVQSIKSLESELIIRLYAKMSKECYYILVLYQIVKVKVMGLGGEMRYLQDIDPNQEEETERLTKLINY